MVMDIGDMINILSYDSWQFWGSPEMSPMDIKLRMVDDSMYLRERERENTKKGKNQYI